MTKPSWSGRPSTPDVVGVLAQSGGAHRLQVAAPEQVHRPVAGDCDREQVGAGNLEQIMGSVESNSGPLGKELPAGYSENQEIKHKALIGFRGGEEFVMQPSRRRAH